MPRCQLAELEASVIGVGAIGRQLAMQLTAWGLPKLRLVDFANVGPTHIKAQGYFHEDVGRAKVDATSSALWQIDPRVHVETIAGRYHSQLEVGDVVFCCVDSLEVRAAIWHGAGSRTRFWCDGRRDGETIRILTACERQGREHYPTTLLAPAEAPAGGLTSMGSIFTAGIAAGLMAHQFTRWLCGLATDIDLSLDPVAGELTVVRASPPTDRRL